MLSPALVGLTAMLTITKELIEELSILLKNLLHNYENILMESVQAEIW